MIDLHPSIMTPEQYAIWSARETMDAACTAALSATMEFGAARDLATAALAGGDWSEIARLAGIAARLQDIMNDMNEWADRAEAAYDALTTDAPA
jgi:hypothetical protein